MILPTTPTPASTGGPRCLILYGAPKCGKTTIVTSLPDYLIAALEDGTTFVTSNNVQPRSIEDIHTLAKLINEAKQPYKFLVIDTIDELEAMCEIEATRVYKASVIGKSFTGMSLLELPNGGGYHCFRTVFTKYFNLLRSLAPYTIFLGHVRDKMLTSEGKEVSVKSLDLTGKVANIACSQADAIGLLRRDTTGVLSAHFSTKDTVTCGSRCSHLINKTITFSSPATLANWKQIYPQL